MSLRILACSSIKKFWNDVAFGVNRTETYMNDTTSSIGENLSRIRHAIHESEWRSLQIGYAARRWMCQVMHDHEVLSCTRLRVDRVSSAIQRRFSVTNQNRTGSWRYASNFGAKIELLAASRFEVGSTEPQNRYQFSTYGCRAGTQAMRCRLWANESLRKPLAAYR